MMAMYFEPKYFLGRKMLTKVMNVCTIIDDLYDTYATIDELKLLTDAIQRWNVDAVDQLPQYMKSCYLFLLEVYNEMVEDLAKEGRSELVQYAIDEVKKYARSSYQEACWNHIHYLPTMEELKELGFSLSTTSMSVTTSLISMGDLVTKEVLDWAISQPLVIRATSIVVQFVDDTYDHEETKHATSIECYVKRYGASKEEAIDELRKQTNNAWMDLNKECLLPTEMPAPILERAFNYARMMFVLYRHGTDGYTYSQTHTKELLTSIFVDPIT